MAMNLKFLLLLSCYLTAFTMPGCKSLDKIDYHPMPEVPLIPFYLDAERMRITVEDTTLLAVDQRASMLVSIAHDKKANVLGFNIYGFTLGNNDEVLIDYRNGIKSDIPNSLSDIENYLYKKEFYPEEIHSFFELLKQHLEAIKFTKAENVEPEKVNTALFIFKFGL